MAVAFFGNLTGAALAFPGRTLRVPTDDGRGCRPARMQTIESHSRVYGDAVAPRLVQALGVALFWRPGHPDGYLTC
ncbi:hypothetical protein ACH4SK_20210 [Streptomyces inhibens]|uniref:hypothetical protein n=1 Tax=Streptomyces inhibens TaxID=2293571 RepID=UPI00378DABCB